MSNEQHLRHTIILAGSRVWLLGPEIDVPIPAVGQFTGAAPLGVPIIWIDQRRLGVLLVQFIHKTAHVREHGQSALTSSARDPQWVRSAKYSSPVDVAESIKLPGGEPLDVWSQERIRRCRHGSVPPSSRQQHRSSTDRGCQEASPNAGDETRAVLSQESSVCSSAGHIDPSGVVLVR
jgi:hypothetical protein